MTCSELRDTIARSIVERLTEIKSDGGSIGDIDAFDIVEMASGAAGQLMGLDGITHDCGAVPPSIHDVHLKVSEWAASVGWDANK